MITLHLEIVQVRVSFELSLSMTSVGWSANHFSKLFEYLWVNILVYVLPVEFASLRDASDFFGCRAGALFGWAA